MESKILTLIADSPALTEALRTLLEKYFSLEKVGLSQTDEELGQIVRASLQGKQNIADAFKEIEQYKTVKEEKSGANPAR